MRTQTHGPARVPAHAKPRACAWQNHPARPRGTWCLARVCMVVRSLVSVVAVGPQRRRAGVADEIRDVHVRSRGGRLRDNSDTVLGGARASALRREAQSARGWKGSASSADRAHRVRILREVREIPGRFTVFCRTAMRAMLNGTS
eukprot:2720977-Prymnesium_polylepis.1